MGHSPAWRPLVGAAFLLSVLGGSGCELGRTKGVKEQVSTKDETSMLVISPVQLETPLGPITAGPVKVESRSAAREAAQEQATRTYDSPALSAAAGALVPPASPALTGTGGGVVGWLLAAIAAGGGALAWWRRRLAERSLEEVVSGIEAAKQRLPDAERRALLEELDGRMSQQSKVLVRDARARKGGRP